MAKWKSPIFSDIRNKLGDNVVFSMWKGRPYMRSYVTPANPNSLAQQANRLHMAALVANWQTYKKALGTPVTLWNAAALPLLISGYNRFIKGMRGAVISTVTVAHATFEMSIDSSALPVDDLQVYTLVSGGGSVKKGPLMAVAVVTSADWVDAWTPAAGDALYLVDTKVQGATTIAPANIDTYGAPLYLVDEAAGTAEPVVLT